MPPHLTRMGYRTTVPTNIRFIFFVASPESEGLCSVKYWLVLQQNILRNFVNCGRNMTATLYHYTNRNAKFAKLRLTSTSVALLVTSLTKLLHNAMQRMVQSIMTWNYRACQKSTLMSM